MIIFMRSLKGHTLNLIILCLNFENMLNTYKKYSVILFGKWHLKYAGLFDDLVIIIIYVKLKN